MTTHAVVRDMSTKMPFHRHTRATCRNRRHIAANGHVLTPGRYVGAVELEDDGDPFEEKMARLAETLREEQPEDALLDAAIAANLEELGYGG